MEDNRLQVMTFLVGAASAAATLATVVALVSVGLILQDISALQNEIGLGLAEFRVLSDDTWNKLMTVHINPTGQSNVSPLNP